MPWITERKETISMSELEKIVIQGVEEGRKKIKPYPKRVLLLPPDLTRYYSGAGRLTEVIYNHLKDTAEIFVIPTLGQHIPHSPETNKWMFGSIPEDHILKHDWKNGCVRVGEINAGFVKEVTKNKVDWPIPITLNKTLMEQQWDLIINIGHVVPHEVLGFANHNKNYFIGLGGKDLICKSHLASATYGIENNLGQLISPTRAIFNKAEEMFLSHLPDMYIQVVMNYNKKGELVHRGIYIGDDLDTYLEAAKQSREENVHIFDNPIKKVVCYMDPSEFHSTWVANKAVYRTRMAIADEGELIVIAPGVERFGEQKEVDDLTRKYGYSGTEKIMTAYKTNSDLQDIEHGTAHLIHGSSEGRFQITYSTDKLTKEEIEQVNYKYMPLSEALSKYNPEKMKRGWNTVDGEEIYFISTPSLGLWSTREKIENRN